MPIKAQMKDYDNKTGKAMKEYATRTSPKKEEIPVKKQDGSIGAKAASTATKPPTKYGEGTSKTTASNKANVSDAQLKKTGLSLRQYMNQWNKTGSRPTGKK